MKILAIRNDRFGEFLLIIPALRALKETFPQAKITLAVNAQAKDLAALIGFADEILVWDNKPHSIFEIIKLSSVLRRKKFDLSIVFNPSKESHILTFFAGIPRRLGYRRKWGFLLTDSILDLKHLGEKHEVEYNLDLAALAGAKTEDKSLALNNVRREEGKNYYGAVAVHPFTSDPRKQWPVERFEQLVERIADELGCRVVVVGQSGENSIGKGIGRGKEKVVNLVDKTSLSDLAVILKSAKILISGDSGPVHLAAAVGTPVIALFRNDLAGKTAKRWGPWAKNYIVLERNCLSDITLTEVLEKVKCLLE